MSSQAIEKQSIFTSKDEIARLPKGKPRNDRKFEIATPAWCGLSMTKRANEIATGSFREPSHLWV